MKRGLLLTVLCLLTVGLVAPPAYAADRTGTPRILSPAAFPAQAAPFTGTVSVDFSEAPLGQYSVAVDDQVAPPENASSWFDPLGGEPVQVEDGTGVVELTLTEPLSKPGRYVVAVADSQGRSWTRTFEVASADGNDHPVIAPIADGSTGPQPDAQVDLTAARMGRYTAELCTVDELGTHCDFLQDIHNTQAMTTTPVPLPDMTSSADAYLHVWHRDQHAGTYEDIDRFRVVGPLRFRDLTVSPAVIYPLRDGYLDRTRIQVSANDVLESARLQVFDGDRRVYTDRETQIWSRDWRYTWNGRDGRGRILPPGDYRVVVDGVSTHGQKDLVRGRVTTARKTLTRSDDAERRGTDTASRSAASGCYVRTYDGELTLDCWGGRSAQVTYAFRVPKSAYGFDWTVRGTVNCCDTGVISRTGRRVTDRRYVVTVRVTDWRSYTVRKVGLDWKYKIQR